MNNKIIKCKKENLIISNKVGEWCLLPYYNHPKGCPNYNKKDICPPKQKTITKLIDTNKPMFFALSTFYLDIFKIKMKEIHPNWTDKQCGCVLYWQSKSRKQMMIQAKKLIINNKIILTCPEGAGVNVYASLNKCGFNLEKIKNLKICHHVALVGTKKF